MRISAIFSKYMEGQEVSAYDKNDTVIDGIVRVKEGKKYILDSKGRIHLMTEMKKIKQVGRKLNEEAEAAYSDALQKFSNYYNDTFDTDKVEKAGDSVKEKIINQYADTSDDSAVKTNKEAFVKDALNSMSAKAAEQRIENGNSTVDMEIEKLKKEQSDGELEESFFDNRRIQKAILREMEVEKTEDAGYVQPHYDYGIDSEHRDDAADACTMMIMNGASRDEVIDDLQLDFEISKDEAARMHDDISIDIDDTYNPIDTISPLQQDLDDEVEQMYDEALNHVPDELCGKNALIEYLGNKFGVDSEKALKESKDIGEAILNLVEQSKKLKKQVNI